MKENPDIIMDNHAKMIETVFALILTLNGNMIEHVYKKIR